MALGFFVCCSLTLRLLGKTCLRLCCPCLVEPNVSDYLDEVLQALGAEKPLNEVSQQSTWSKYWRDRASQKIPNIQEEALQYYECTLHGFGNRSRETRCVQRGHLVVTYNYVLFIASFSSGSNLVARWDGICGCTPVDWYDNKVGIRQLEDTIGGVFLRLEFLGNHYWRVGDFADPMTVLTFVTQLRRVRDSSWAENQGAAWAKQHSLAQKLSASLSGWIRVSSCWQTA
eukprot:Protomagalhaensia_wolfi_Nauph_80__1630@NODE_2005_length_1247_cov_37_495861_g1569_i0_p1_GENE_NODE_2005_length_1247_cov_37_495861_g1569_i0NODE_2005_length_1247_cov_37_495861_g1569_i0_p1_ORF_typecomplete_len242_score18_20_NODE_2005_length_1247_cov_37_495861_g1569_i040726